jgi:ribosomal protein S30
MAAVKESIVAKTPDRLHPRQENALAYGNRIYRAAHPRAAKNQTGVCDSKQKEGVSIAWA